MSYGYLGDSSTKIKQVKKNDGIITASEAFDLETKGHLGGSWELIQTQSHSVYPNGGDIVLDGKKVGTQIAKSSTSAVRG